MRVSKSLQVIPDSIVFKDFEPGKNYSIDIWAKNIGRKPTKIRFSLVGKSKFTVPPNKSLITVPGLEVKSCVKFFSILSQEEKGTLRVQCDDTIIDIPIEAYPPSVTFAFNTRLIEFGTVACKTSISQGFQISNNGSLEGKYILSCTEEEVKISPETGTLSPNLTLDCAFTFKPQHPGKYNFNINLKIDGNPTEIAPLQVTADVVDHSLVLLYEDKEVDELTFGHVFFGQKRIMQVKVVNKGPCKRSFVILPPHDPSSPSSKLTVSRAQSANYDPDVVFSALPCEGLLPPFGSTVVSMIFCPPKTPLDDVIDVMFNHISTIEVVETGQAFNFQLSGLGVKPHYVLSAVDFNFEYKKVRTYSTQILTIMNKSQYLPITFKVEEVAQFHFKPETGIIPPNQKKNISITFAPNNLGAFEEKTFIIFCDGLSKQHLNLIGNSLAQSDEPKKFIRTEIYETDPIAEYNSLHPDERYGFSQDDIKHNDVLKQTFHKYITDSAQKRNQTKFLKSYKEQILRDVKSELTRTGRPFTQEDIDLLVTDKLKERGPEEENPVDLGLGFSQGMDPPEPKIPNTGDIFVIENPEKLGLISTKPKAPNSSLLQRKKPMDDRIVMKKKFKSKPTTPPEINECSRVLTPTQQLLVSSSHTTLNFGIVSVLSMETRSFTVTNNLEQYILIDFEYDAPELKKSTPNSQVIPPMQTAGFDIIFTSSKQMNFIQAIKYSINKKHQYTLNVCAQVVPIDIRLSRTTVEFIFPYDYSQPYIKEFVTVHNNSNSFADFSWAGFEGAFSVTYEKGLIEPRGTHNAELTFVPKNISHSEATVQLQVVGGQTRKLKLIGDTGKPKILTNKKKIDFGLMPIGVSKTMTFRLKNAGQDDGIYSISSDDDEILSYMPTHGRLSSGEYKVVQISVKCVAPNSFSHVVQVAICGANPINITVIGKAELPQVELFYNNLDYGKMFIGSMMMKNLTLKNVGQIPAVLFLDLTDYPNFYIEFSSELSNISSNEHANSIIQVSDMRTIPSVRSEAKFLTAESSIVSLLSIQETENEKRSIVYKITIIENSSIDFTLVFQPKIVGDCSFELPITLMNILTSSFHIQPLVTAEAIHAPISPSESLIHFGIATVFSENNPNNRPVIKELHLKNESKQPVTFIFENDSKVFECDHNTGKIDYSGEFTVFVSFKPNKAIPFNFYLPLYVATEQGQSLISKIQLTGVGTSRPYHTSTNYVCMPITPLNVKSETTIDIINTSFIDANLSINLSITEKNFPISIVFPEGNELRHTIAKKPLHIIFNPIKPTSFSTVVALTDDKGHSYSFTLSVTSDNSVFTLYPFISFESYQIQSGGGRALTAVVDKYVKNSEFLASLLSTSDILKAENLTGQTSVLMIDFMIKFLNSLVLSSQISLFPDDFIMSDGALIVEMISNLCGNKKPQGLNNLLKPNGTNNKKGSDQLQIKMDVYKKILHFLMSNGCNLAEVKPEFLLPQSEFVLFMRQKLTKQLLDIDYFGANDLNSLDKDMMNEFTSTQSFLNALMPRIKVIDHLYPIISIESWMMVVLQTIKVFYLSKIDCEKFNTLPGVQDALKFLKDHVQSNVLTEINRSSRNLLGSNIYSQTEGMLLKWGTIHYCKMNPEKPFIITEFQQFKDPFILEAIIKSHIPTANIRLDQGNEPRTKTKNLDIISKYLKQLKINLFPSLYELGSGNTIIMTLFIAQLYQTLPHYIPSASIEFRTQLNHKIIQSVTIQNASPNEIMFTAQVEGSRNFKPVNNSIIMPPNSVREFQVEYSAFTHTPERAVLTLVPGRPKNTMKKNNDSEESSTKDGSNGSQPPIFASTIVIELLSYVTIAQPIKTFNMTGKIYEPTKLELPLINPIGEACTFQVMNKFFLIMDHQKNVLLNKKQIDQQIMDFLVNPTAETEITEPDSQFMKHIQEHQAFLLGSKELELPDQPEETSHIEIEFNPISLGTYRCLVLFVGDLGEFLYEIIAETTLPDPITLDNAVKVETKQKTTVNLPIEVLNQNLFKSIAYSFEKATAFTKYVSDRKFKDLMVYRIREIQSLFNQTFISSKYSASVSQTSFFEVPSEISLFKTSMVENFSKETTNTIPVSFFPSKPGLYPCKVILIHPFDVRVYSIVGNALAITKTIDILLETVAGRDVEQEIPLNNPSKIVWQYKALISGDLSFTTNNRFNIAPKSTHNLVLAFSAKKMGEFEGEMTVTNLTKEAVTIYKLRAVVNEPPAEEKIQIKCKARKETSYKIKLPKFISNGNLNVTSDIPIITYPKTVKYVSGMCREQFVFKILAMRSGVAAGMITFTDPESKNYYWYVIEIHVDSPDPEDTIEVETSARKSATITIPINNPRDHPISFAVDFTEDDIFGPAIFTVPANSTLDYNLVFSPLTEMDRFSLVSFYNDLEGEYIYLLHLHVEPPEVNIISQLSAAIGKFATTTILLDNPLTKPMVFRVENSNQMCFQIISKPIIQIPPKDSKKIEVRYIPSCVGTKEIGEISFMSPELGNFLYKVSGVGKPPQPLSPIIIEAPIMISTSGMINFQNPFPYTMKYTISLDTDHPEIFKFLNKRRFFSLSTYGEILQVPFSFTPPYSGQFNAIIIVAVSSPTSNLRWLYPVIGNAAIVDTTVVPEITGAAGTSINQEVEYPLVGEREDFDASQYKIHVEFPRGYEWMSKIFDLHPLVVEYVNKTPNIKFNVIITPRRPISIQLDITLENPMNQRWHQIMKVNVSNQEPLKKITVECALNKITVHRIEVDEIFTEKTAYHAYFAPGSAQEFSVVPSQGFIPASTQSKMLFPFEVRFEPKMYGKVMRGLLVVDTLETQYIYELEGKMPQYVPPLISFSGKIDNHMPESARKHAELQLTRKRNIIRDNIENARIARPHSSISPRATRAKTVYK